MVDNIMDRAGRGQQSSATLQLAVERELNEKKLSEDRTLNVADTAKTPAVRKYRTKHMKMFPELYRSDVSINPSYSGLKNLPYYVVCRRRALMKKKQITRQLNREIMHIAMMQSYALASVRVDRIFSVGFPPEATLVPDFATEKQRRRINELMTDR